MTVIDTPDAIAAFRLLSLRGQLRLEKIGMRSSGGALRPRLSREFSLSSRAPYDDYIAAIDARLSAIRERSTDTADNPLIVADV